MSILNRRKCNQVRNQGQIRIAFRADGGPGIGMGHIMRCLALGLEIKDLGHEVKFITLPDKQVEQVITDYGFNTITLSQPLNLSAELKTINEIIQDNDINIVITDSYTITQSYLMELRDKVDLLVSIDDLNKWIWPSHVVINGNLYGNDLSYQSLDRETCFLLGGKYTLLRREFKDTTERKIKPEIEQVLVTVGGSDVLNLTPLILQSLGDVPGEFRITVVIGPNFDNLEEIKLITSNLTNKEVALKTRVRNMQELMLASDLAISSGGSTLYELAVTGTPAVVLLQADNQVLAAEKMDQEGTIINLGMGKQVSSNEIRDAVMKLMFSQIRADMAVKGQHLIDGFGAKRCARIILDQYYTKWDNGRGRT